jgi:hypothetical protein
LIEGGMESPRVRIDQLRQRINVRGFQLAQTAAIQDLGRQFVLSGQLCQGIFIRRRARRLVASAN